MAIGEGSFVLRMEEGLVAIGCGSNCNQVASKLIKPRTQVNSRKSEKFELHGLR